MKYGSGSSQGAVVVTGTFSDAYDLLQARLHESPQDTDLRFTLATCLLHMERYNDAVVAYEQVLAEDSYLDDERGLKAARLGQQPDLGYSLAEKRLYFILRAATQS
jgi:thioredoxin-like negative regulator of GroEL